MVGERRLELLLGAEHDLGVLADEVQQRAEALERQQLGDVHALGLARLAARERARGGRDLGELAVLDGELGRGRDLDLRDLPQRALGERREPAQRLDLDVEGVDPHGALLGRREDVEQPAAQRELAALLDLLDALVAGVRRAPRRTRRGRSARPPAG